MTKRDKLRKRLRNNPNNVTFDQIRTLLEQEDFKLVRISGSHHIFKRDVTIFVVPVHNNRVKAVYVKRTLELLD
ncbi:MAG: type II toxin-antitoxin system HicA family toxin [Cyanobacteria bacterium P01_G01_bin.54]